LRFQILKGIEHRERANDAGRRRHGDAGRELFVSCLWSVVRCKESIEHRAWSIE